MNELKSRHPVTLIAYYSLLIFILILLKDPLLLLVCFVTVLLICMQYFLGKQLLNEIYFIVAMAFLTIITALFFYHNGVTPLLYINDQAVTYEVIIFSFALSILFGTLWLIIQLIIATLPSASIIYVFTKIIPSLGIFMAMSIRFVPELKIRFQTVIEAQRAIGYLSSKSFVEVKLLKIKIAYECIFWAFEKSMKKAIMMRVRGFSNGKRTSYKKYKLFPLDKILLLLVVTITIYLVLTYSSATYYYFPALKSMTLSSVQFPYLLFIFLPLGMEWKGWFQWYYYKSKM